MNGDLTTLVSLQLRSEPVKATLVRFQDAGRAVSDFLPLFFKSYPSPPKKPSLTIINSPKHFHQHLHQHR